MCGQGCCRSAPTTWRPLSPCRSSSCASTSAPPRGPLCYCPRLLLDRRLPIAVGRLLYGYDKRRALIRMAADSYRIAEPTRGEPLLNAHFRTAAAPVEPSRNDAAMLFDLPVISRAAHGWRYSLADFGLAHALIEPLELKLTIHRPFVSGLPVGEFVIAGIEGDISRAFRLHTSWRLLGPWARSTCEGPAQCPDPSWRKPTPGRTDRPSDLPHLPDTIPAPRALIHGAITAHQPTSAIDKGRPMAARAPVHLALNFEQTRNRRLRTFRI